ncbi:endonuclease domain-containing protein [Ekhidna sp.]
MRAQSYFNHPCHSLERRGKFVDFYCPSEKLIIELDGAHHFTSAGFEKGRDRDRTLKDLGFKILRFENQDVFDSLENVLESIRSNFSFPPCKEG